MTRQLWVMNKISSQEYTKRTVVHFFEGCGGFLGNTVAAWAGERIASAAREAAARVSGPLGFLASMALGWGGAYLFRKGAEKLTEAEWTQRIFQWIDEKYFDKKVGV